MVGGGSQHGQLLADPPQPAGPAAQDAVPSSAHQLDHVCDQEHALTAECCPGGTQGQLGSLGQVTSTPDHAVCREAEPIHSLLRVIDTVALLNGTPLGRVLNERQLLRHRSVADQSFVVGAHRRTVRIDLLRYVAWLHDRLHVDIDDLPLIGDISYHGVYALLARQEYRCALTGRHLRPEEASLDHVIPVSRHGPHRLENAQVLHKDVNRAKGARTNPEFIALCRDVVAWADRSISN